MSKQFRRSADRLPPTGTHPAVLLGLLPGLAALTDTDDDVHAVVAGVEALSVTLRAIANEGEGVVLEVLLELRERPVCEGPSLVSMTATPEPTICSRNRDVDANGGRRARDPIDQLSVDLDPASRLLVCDHASLFRIPRKPLHPFAKALPRARGGR